MRGRECLLALLKTSTTNRLLLTLIEMIPFYLPMAVSKNCLTKSERCLDGKE